ncbi:hypothetical protein HRbin16_02798 [bacterium HR16]|nr:hypothetical protein HRbin16_02798 [bacterium HR16]
MRATRTVGMLLLLLCCMGSILAQQPFTYQGMLKTSGIPANGNYDLQFSLWTANSGGSQVGSTVTRIGVSVSNGLFTTELDFGSVWDGSERYLQIAVRPSGSGSYTTLSPRVKVNRVPYSQLAYSALTVPWSGIIGAPSSFPPGGSAGGDLSGSYPNPTVAKIQGRAVASTAPTAGQVLKWDGSAWSPGTDMGDTFWQASGSNIFYNAGNVGISTSSPLYPLHVETGTGTRAIYGLHTAPNGINYGVWGQSASTDGRGVYGLATASSGDTYGVWGQSASTDGTGVYGLATASSGFTYGVFGQSNSTDGRGVFGWTNASSGTTYGVYGRSDSPSGYGAFGLATAGSGFTYGVYGQSDSPSGTGVYGLATATSGFTYGGRFESAGTGGIGVYGLAYDTSGVNFGVYGESRSPWGSGLFGVASAGGKGVWGRSTTGDGVVGETNAANKSGVWGRNNVSGGYGVAGSSTEGTGVGGWSTSGRGVFGYAGTIGPTYGVWGQSDSNEGYGVYGWAPATSGITIGVRGQSDSPSGAGVDGLATATSGLTYGVVGSSYSPSGYGVYSYGNFGVAGTKSFQMDHPLRPETHYLNHFCTEGPEPYNAYRGNVVTDANGYATITLPSYFESINRDPTYHLTVIDNSDDFVLAKVVREVQNNQFVIRTNKPHVKVSWEVKAVRNDRWVQEYGYQTEQPKPAEYRGKYLHPELYGQPKELGIHYHPKPEREGGKLE